MIMIRNKTGVKLASLLMAYLVVSFRWLFPLNPRAISMDSAQRSRRKIEKSVTQSEFKEMAISMKSSLKSLKS